MQDYEPFASLAIALGCGLLIGLQREHAAKGSAANEPAAREPDAPATIPSIGGVRTYPLYSLAGALCALLAPHAGPVIPALVFVMLMAPVLIVYVQDVRRDGQTGFTSEVAFAIAFLLGAVAATEGLAGAPGRRWLLCAVTAVATMALLTLKDPLHRLAALISRDEMFDSVQFLVFAVMVVPFLPDRSMGPLEAFNPFKMGLLVVLMASISFVGYVAVRLLGPGRGLGVAGLVGGLVSSTAVTLSSAGRSKQEPAVSRACALAIVLACTIMLVRVVVEVAAVNAALVPAVGWPLGAMFVAGLAAAAWLGWSSPAASSTDDPLAVRNPFEMGSALKFAALFALVQLIAKVAQSYAGASGLYLAAAVSGLTDVDAITLSISRMALGGGLEPAVATRAILIAVGVNNFTKAGLAFWLGSRELGRTAGVALAAMVVAGWLMAL